MKLVHVVGARPNFMKAAPVMAALKRKPGLSQYLVHSGQHYDRNMSAVFFEELGLPVPDADLGVGSGSHAAQTAAVMVGLEPILCRQRPDVLVVYGDVNSTLAAALTAVKLGIPVAHVEAGLRSFDRSMPEETNRLLTDRIAAMLFTPSRDGDDNLLREGASPEDIHLVGNVMIDTLVRLLPQADPERRRQALPASLGEALPGQGYVLVTLHRPANVDNDQVLRALVETLARVAHRIPVVWPVHPRTRQRLAKTGLEQSAKGLHLSDPLGYLDFLALQQGARAVITDSGGIQEETTYLGVPCLTVRDNTERPVTVSHGTNLLVGRDMDLLLRELERILDGRGKTGVIPPLWDGRTGERIADIVSALA